MKLYNANFSPNALRVRAIAHELGIPLEIIEIDLRKGDNRTAEYLAINPNGKVPVLVDGDFVLWESRAICDYLAATKPGSGLLPNDARGRALVEQWSYWQAIHLTPPMQKLAFELVMKEMFGRGAPDPETVETERKATMQMLAVLEAGLEGREYIAGTLSVADFYLASTFMFRQPSGVSLDGLPNTAAWIARIEARESWQTALAPMLKALGR